MLRPLVFYEHQRIYESLLQLWNRTLETLQCMLRLWMTVTSCKGFRVEEGWEVMVTTFIVHPCLIRFCNQLSNHIAFTRSFVRSFFFLFPLHQNTNLKKHGLCEKNNLRRIWLTFDESESQCLSDKDTCLHCLHCLTDKLTWTLS